MFTLLILCAVVGGDSTGSSTAASTAGEGRKLTEINAELTAVLKREATAKSLEERGPAIRQLVALYVELRRDPRFESHDFSKNMVGQIGNRLSRTKGDLQRQLAREARRPLKDEAEQEAELKALDSLAATLAAGDSLAVSPALAFHRGGNGALDNGRALVELIERTINPAFWDTNGGTGSVVYYAPLMCLVVTATGHVHEQIGGLVDGLRK